MAFNLTPFFRPAPLFSSDLEPVVELDCIIYRPFSVRTRNTPTSIHNNHIRQTSPLQKAEKMPMPLELIVRRI